MYLDELEKQAKKLGVRFGARRAARSLVCWVEDGKRREYRAAVDGLTVSLVIGSKKTSRECATAEQARRRFDAFRMQAGRAHILALQRLVKRAEAARRKAARAAGKGPPRAPRRTVEAYRIAGARGKLAVLMREGLRLITFTTGFTSAGMKGLRATAKTLASPQAAEAAAQKTVATWTRQGFSTTTLTPSLKTFFLGQARRRFP
jgi:hypothetical protein